MVNTVIRQDVPPPLMQSCCRIVRSMRDACPVLAPPQLSHRGSTMHCSGLAFFSPGVKFRVPCFLSTTVDRDAALRHCFPSASPGAAFGDVVPVLWHIQCSRRSSASFLSACLPLHPPSPSPLLASARQPLLRTSRTPSRVSPARVSLLYSSSCVAASQHSPDISLQDAVQDEGEVCHSALWLQGSDVFLYVPYSVFVVVAVRRPSAAAVASGQTAEVRAVARYSLAGVCNCAC